jgi:hypothetical protein
MRPILILAATVTTARAEPAGARWTVGIEPRLGVLVPTSKLHTFVSGGVEIDYAVGRFAIAADVSLTRPSYSESVMDPRVASGDYTIQQTELVTGLLATYRLSSGRLQPRLGVGPILHMLRSNETTGAAPGENTSQQTKLGVELLGGVDYRVGTGFVAVDLRFLYSKLDTTLTGDSNAGSIALLFGYRVVL